MTERVNVVVLIDMTHARDVVRVSYDEVTPPLLNRMGTGGNQVPVILREMNNAADT